MVIDKICRMTVKDVKSKSESFFSISHGTLEVWRKNLSGGGGRIPPPPGMDRVTEQFWKMLGSLKDFCIYRVYIIKLDIT